MCRTLFTLETKEVLHGDIKRLTLVDWKNKINEL